MIWILTISEDEIIQYLKKVNCAIDHDQYDIKEERIKNSRTKFELGLRRSDIIAGVYSLLPGDCYKDPEPDRNKKFKDPFWFFKKEIAGFLMYIKLNLIEQGEYGDFLVVFSYHFEGMHG